MTWQLGKAASEDSCVLSPVGELDVAAAPSLWEALDGALRSGVARIVLDMRGLTFIDASGIRVIMRAVRACGPHEARLEIRRSESAQVARVFEIMGMADLLPYE